MHEVLNRRDFLKAVSGLVLVGATAQASELPINRDDALTLSAPQKIEPKQAFDTLVSLGEALDGHVNELLSLTSPMSGKESPLFTRLFYRGQFLFVHEGTAFVVGRLLNDFQAGTVYSLRTEKPDEKIHFYFRPEDQAVGLEKNDNLVFASSGDSSAVDFGTIDTQLRHSLEVFRDRLEQAKLTS